jgi:hypothetical protein
VGYSWLSWFGVCGSLFCLFAGVDGTGAVVIVVVRECRGVTLVLDGECDERI